MSYSRPSFQGRPVGSFPREGPVLSLMAPKNPAFVNACLLAGDKSEIMNDDSVDQISSNTYHRILTLVIIAIPECVLLDYFCYVFHN